MFKHDEIAVDALDLFFLIVEMLYWALIDRKGGFESRHTCLLNFINH